MEWCEIFTTGTHKDSKGNKRTWIKEDLEKIKNNFYNVNPDVPICCGHPKSNSPAYGWCKEMKVVDDLAKKLSKLYVSYKDVVPEFKEAYRKGLFKTRSLSLTKDLVPRHIAFLGAQTPAIKGLETFCFEESTEDDIIINFSESQLNEYNKSANAEPFGAGGAVGSTLIKKEGDNMPQDEELTKQLAQKDEEIKALQKQLDEQKKDAITKDFEDFCDSAIAEGHILPAQRDDVLNILFACNDTSINFEDGTSQEASGVFKNFVKNLKQMDFETIANEKKVEEYKSIDFSDSEDIKESIQAIQKEYADKGILLNSAEAYAKLKR